MSTYREIIAANIIETLVKNDEKDTINIITNYLNNIYEDNDYKIKIIESLDISDHEKEELILALI
jgi:hypothetical protein